MLDRRGDVFARCKALYWDEIPTASAAEWAQIFEWIAVTDIVADRASGDLEVTMQYQGDFSRLGSRRSISSVHEFLIEACRVLTSIGTLISAWQARERQRRMLIEMSDDQLSDIGVRREDALREASKPFWRY